MIRTLTGLTDDPTVVGSKPAPVEVGECCMSPPRAKDFHQGDTDHDDAVGLGADRRLPWDIRLAGAVCERKSRRNPHSRVGASFAIDGFA